MDPDPNIQIRTLLNEITTKKYSKGHTYECEVGLKLPGGLTSIFLENITFNEGIDIQVPDDLEIKLIKCTIAGTLSLSTKSGTKKIILDQTSIQKLDIQSGNKVHLFNESKIGQFKSTEEIVLEGKSLISNLHSSGSVEVINSTLSKVLIARGFIISKEESTINDIQLYDSTSISGSGNTVFGRIELIDISTLNGNFNRCKITHLEFNGYKNKNSLLFLNVYGTKRIKIFNSDLNGLKLFRCDFRKTEFEVSNGSLKGIITDSVKWKKSPFITIIRLEGFEPDSSTFQDDQLEVRDLYRHLKISAIDQQDKVNELLFYALEMESYNRSLPCLRPFTDKLILWVSRNTNYYGLNWWLPIIWYVGISTGLYLLLVLLSVPQEERNQILCQQDFGRIFNPTHNINNFDFLDLKYSYLVLIDFLGRIFQGLLVYQTISAFRKFFK